MFKISGATASVFFGGSRLTRARAKPLATQHKNAGTKRPHLGARAPASAIVTLWAETGVNRAVQVPRRRSPRRRGLERDGLRAGTPISVFFKKPKMLGVLLALWC
jgi:hypothetical protein